MGEGLGLGTRWRSAFGDGGFPTGLRSRAARSADMLVFLAGGEPGLSLSAGS